MKKLLFIAIILAAGFWFYAHRSPDSSPTIKLEPTVSRPDAKNATFDFEGGAVTLKNGKASEPIAPGSALTTDTTLTDYIAYGDLNSDGKSDTAVVLMQSGGGSGIFVYVAGYVSGNVGYKGTNAVFVGDRISPQSISVENGVIKLDYLDRKPDEPLAAAPTVPGVKSFVYRSGELEER